MTFFKNQFYHLQLLMARILKDVQAQSPDAYKYLGPYLILKPKDR